MIYFQIFMNLILFQLSTFQMVPGTRLHRRMPLGGFHLEDFRKSIHGFGMAPSLDSSDHQDDITCLGSGIPNLTFTDSTGIQGAGGDNIQYITSHPINELPRFYWKPQQTISHRSNGAGKPRPFLHPPCRSPFGRLFV